MARIIIAYFATILPFLGLDFIWLTQVGPALYNPILAPILIANPRLGAAAAFYLLYVVGLLYFAVFPGLAARSARMALINGGLFGLFAYATYDLTNQATLEIWSSKITVADMAWGTFVSGVSAAIGCAITRRLSKG